MNEVYYDEDESSPIYYRLYMAHDGEICVLTMQWFDEHGYDKDRFLSEHQFKSEADAIQFLKDYDKQLPEAIQRAIDKFLSMSVKNILD